MLHWLFIESSDGGLLEKQDFDCFFLPKNLFFNPKTPRKYSKYLDKSIYGLKQLKEAQKSKINLNLKIFSLRESTLSSKEKEMKKTLR